MLTKTQTITREAEQDSPAAAVGFCFVLTWPFTNAGGVNHVINNLMEEFRSGQSSGITPMALQVEGDEPAVQQDALRSGVTRVFMRLRPPYIAGKGMRSLLAFTFHLPQSLLALRRLAVREKIQVFNLHFPGLEALHFLLLKRLGLYKGEVILSIHGSDIRSAHQGSATYKFFARWILRWAPAVVACSDGLKEEVLLLEPRASVQTIYNGIDIERFTSHPNPHFKWPFEAAGRNVIVNVSAFEFRKGQDVLLQAFREVVKNHPDCVLVLVGKPGPVSGEIRKTITEAGLGSCVFMMENVAHGDIYTLLRHATLFVLATRWRKGVMGEGFALALLEAGAAKLPVVATASCGVEEIIRTGETGLVAPLEDAAALARALTEMLERPSLAHIMGENLYKEVRDNFRWDSAAQQYARLGGLNSTPARGDGA